jgi:serine protease AprX
VIAAIQRAIQLKDQYNIRVINLSVGRPIYESYTLDPLDQAVEAAYQAGITVVAAAGNNGRDQSVTSDGHGTITAPGNDPYVITVGATKPEGTPVMFDDLMASYSSRGPSVLDHIVKPDLVAPGNQIISLTSPKSTLAMTYPQLQVFPSDNPCSANPASCPGAGSYLQISGTSMATPVVAGAVAILIQQDPSLTPDQVKARLMRSAWKGYPQSSTAYGTDGTPYFTTYDVFTVGAGYLDLAAALQDTSKPAGVAYSPAVVFNSTDNTMKVDFSGAGAQTILWGTSLGAGAGSSDTILWGTTAVWGDSVFRPAAPTRFSGAPAP